MAKNLHKIKKRSLIKKLIDNLIIQKSRLFGFEKEDFQQNKNLFSIFILVENDFDSW